MNRITVLTFNVGGWRLWNRWPFPIGPVPFVNERMAELPSALRACGADVILLQEVCEPEHRQRLQRMLRNQYPYSSAGTQTDDECHGLLILSRFPLHCIDLLLFTRVEWWENHFLKKGALFAQLETRPGHTVTIVNMHLVSGSVWSPRSGTVEGIRAAQIDELVTRIDEKRLEPCIIGGDLNAGPEASKINYDQLLKRGYEDACNGVEPGEQITWDPENPLVARGPQWKCPPHRCDHIIVSRRFFPIRRRVMFMEPIVTVSERKFPLSDHYGVMATLDC